MQMTSPDSEQTQLTPAQLERQKRLDRFNRLTIYLPLGVLTLLIVGVVGLMLWLTLFGDAESISEWRSFSSATADLIIILMVLPMILFVAVVPILAAGWFWYTWESPRPVESWLQRWLRRTDRFVERSAQHVDTASKKAADLSIQYHAASTRVGRVIQRAQQFVSPHQDEEDRL